MNFIIKLLLVFIILQISHHTAIGQTFKWARKAGSKSPTNESGSKVAVDAQGNSYVTGGFTNTASFGHLTLTSAGGSDIFIAKYDSAGTILWAKRAGGITSDGGSHIALDGNGNLYITGTIQGIVNFNGTIIGPIGFYSTFIAKYDVNGNFIWAINPNVSTKQDTPGGLAIDPLGNILVSGLYLNLNYLDRGFFVVKYNPSGSQILSKNVETDGGANIDVDNLGNFYVTGGFSTTTNFGTTTLTTIPYSLQTFIVKYDPNGNEIWARTIKSPLPASNNNFGRQIDIGPNGNIYLTGGFTSAIILGGDTLTNASIRYGTYITSYSSSGSFLWGKVAGSPEIIHGTDITTDSQGSIYLIGVFETAAHFGNLSLTAYPSTRVRPDIYIAKYDSVGNEIWVKKAGGSEDDYGLGIEVDIRGDIYLTGYFSEVAAFDNIIFPFNADDAKEIFLAKLGNAGPPPTTLSFNFILDSVFCVNATFSVPFTTTGIFSPGNVFTVQLSDQSGSFTSPIDIGSGSTSPINATIPSNIPSGTGYRFRLVSSRPSFIGPTHLGQIQIINLLGVSAGPDLTVCLNSSLLILSRASPTVGSWSGKGVLNNLFDPAVAGIGSHSLSYTVRNGACINVSTKKVNVVPVPEAIARVLPNSCSSPETIIGHAPFKPGFENSSLHSETYFWEFGDGQTSTDSIPNHTYTAPGSYDVFLTADNAGDCKTRIKVAQILIKEPKPIPNIITPNNDNLNDTFKPDITCLALELKVYNRWGKLVFEDNNYKGNLGGDNQVEGTYYYHLKTVSQSWKGWLEIIR